MAKKISLIITDVVESIRASKIDKKVARQGERFWVVKCRHNTVRVFQTELANQQFIAMLENKTVVGKKIRFGCQTFWNHVIEAEILTDE